MPRLIALAMKAPEAAGVWHAVQHSDGKWKVEGSRGVGKGGRGDWWKAYAAFRATHCSGCWKDWLHVLQTFFRDGAASQPMHEAIMKRGWP